MTATAEDGTTTELTDLVSDVRLEWDKPDGVYQICVLSLTHNAGCHRDYINMTEESSVRLLLEAVYEPHWRHYAADFGKTIAGFFSDEPELGNGHLYEKGNTLGCGQDLPWGPTLEREFAAAYGVGWRAALSALFEQDQAEKTARVHTMYMDCLTKRVRTAFSEQLGAWCRAHGVWYIGHIIEDDGQHCRTGASLGHYFRGLQGQDMAGIDDIGGQVLPQGEDQPVCDTMGRPRNGEFYHYALGALAASAAAIEPAKQGNALCEIFGNYGWAEGVRLEKYLADHFLVRGINYFVPHAFSGKAFPDPDCPPHFYAHGHNPQYRHFGMLMAYMDRVATLTSSGRHDAPVAVLYHGEAEWCDAGAMPFERALRPLYDHQIQCHVLPADVFSEPERYRTRIQNPLVVNGHAYQAFVVPGAERIPATAARGLADLAMAGLPVFFVQRKPVGLCEGGSLPPALEACPVLEPEELPAAVRAAGVKAPVVQPQSNRLRLLGIHGDTPCVLVVNEGAEAYNGILTLPEFSKACFWYDPWENRCERADASVNDAGLQVKLRVEPLKSRILVAGDAPVGLSVPPRVGKAVPMKPWMRSVCEGASYPAFSQKKRVSLPDHLAEEQPDFSGFVRYETTFSLPSSKELLLDISDAAEGVEVFLNGRSEGIQISPPFCYRLHAGAGENHLAIEVATTLERQCYPLLDRYQKMIVRAPQGGSGLTGTVTLREVMKSSN